jgi:hypothetical protein
MKTTILLTFFLLLSACTPVETIREVKVPVIIPCVDQLPNKPSMPLQEAGPEEDLFVLTKKALAEIELRKGYEGELESALVACKK